MPRVPLPASALAEQPVGQLGAFALLIIPVGLVILARRARSRLLAIVALAYTATALAVDWPALRECPISADRDRWRSAADPVVHRPAVALPGRRRAARTLVLLAIGAVLSCRRTAAPTARRSGRRGRAGTSRRPRRPGTSGGAGEAAAMAAASHAGRLAGACGDTVTDDEALDLAHEFRAESSAGIGRPLDGRRPLPTPMWGRSSPGSAEEKSAMTDMNASWKARSPR